MPGPPRGIALVQKMSRGDETMDALSKRVTPDRIAQAIMEALEANYITKNGELPDHRTRIEAAKLYLNYSVGLPVQRVVTQTIGEREPDADVLARILGSAAAREGLAKLLASSEDGRRLLALAGSAAAAPAGDAESSAL